MCNKQSEITYNPEWHPEYSIGKSYRWVENVTPALRFVGASHDIISLRHTGYYTNEFCDETVNGEVYQLPARNGSPQYVPAVNDPCNSNCACIDFHSVTDDKEEAARWADRMAELWAEVEREYQAKASAEARLEDIDAEIKAEYLDFKRIAKELRANCDKLQGISVVRELVRNEWQRTKNAIHQLKAERQRIETEGYIY